MLRQLGDKLIAIRRNYFRSLVSCLKPPYVGVPMITLNPTDSSAHRAQSGSYYPGSGPTIPGLIIMGIPVTGDPKSWPGRMRRSPYCLYELTLKLLTSFIDSAIAT